LSAIHFKEYKEKNHALFSAIQFKKYKEQKHSLLSAIQSKEYKEQKHSLIIPARLAQTVCSVAVLVGLMGGVAF